MRNLEPEPFPIGHPMWLLDNYVNDRDLLYFPPSLREQEKQERRDREEEERNRY